MPVRAEGSQLGGVELPLSQVAAASGEFARTSPGQLASHYAPSKPVVLNATAPTPDQALLAFGPVPRNFDGHVFNLSTSGDLVEAAANLFIGLRELDASDAIAIAAMPIPKTGLGLAINNRLERAAARRPGQ